MKITAYKHVFFNRFTCGGVDAFVYPVAVAYPVSFVLDLPYILKKTNEHCLPKEVISLIRFLNDNAATLFEHNTRHTTQLIVGGLRYRVPTKAKPYGEWEVVSKDGVVNCLFVDCGKYRFEFDEQERLPKFYYGDKHIFISKPMPDNLLRIIRPMLSDHLLDNEEQNWKFENITRL